MKTSKYLYQYDVNQSFTDIHGTYVDCIINNVVYRIAAVNGSCLIPDELLQIKGSHKVYECFDDGTITEFTFTVTERPMPPDYVYTPTQRLTFDGLVKKVNDAVAELYGMAEDGIFDGDDGVSPEVSVSVITGGHKVTITDAEGEHSFNVLNGTNGAKGDKGDKGDQGEKGDDGDAYTITDADYSAIAAMTAPMVTGFVKTVNNIEPDANGNVNVQGGGGSSDVTKAYVDQQDQHIIDMIPDVSGKADKSEIPVVPSNVSAFTNDAEYITSSDIPSIPTKTSELTNDSDFTTTGEVADQLDLKQNKLVAGANISIDEDTNTISATGSGGSTVTMSDNVSGGVDLTVDGTKKTIAKESDVTSLNNALSELEEDVENLETLITVGSITDSNLTFVNKSFNNQTGEVLDGYRSNRTITPDMIKVIESDYLQLVIESGFVVNFIKYDEDLSYLGYENIAVTQKVENAPAFFRLMVTKFNDNNDISTDEAKNAVSVVFGNNDTFSSLRTDIDTLKSQTENVGVITDSFDKVYRDNYFNPDEVITGKYLNSNGSFTSDSSWNTSCLIPVSIGDTLYFSFQEPTKRSTSTLWFVGAYDSDETWISNKYKSNGGNPYTAEHDGYIRFAYKPSGKTDFMVNTSEAFTNYIPYGYSVVLKSSADKKWVGKKWCCVGDSLTEYNAKTTKHYFDYVADITGITIHNMGVSGTGYMQTQSSNTAFYQRITSVPTDSDVVTIFGSGNDCNLTLGTPTDSGTDTVCGCINTTIDHLYSVLPTVSLGIVAPCPWGEFNPAITNNRMALYVEALKTICANRSIPFLDLYHSSNLRPWDSSFLPVAYSKDNGGSCHPDEHGHKLLAPRFKSFIDSLIV